MSYLVVNFLRDYTLAKKLIDKSHVRIIVMLITHIGTEVKSVLEFDKEFLSVFEITGEHSDGSTVGKVAVKVIVFSEKNGNYALDLAFVSSFTDLVSTLEVEYVSSLSGRLKSEKLCPENGAVSENLKLCKRR